MSDTKTLLKTRLSELIEARDKAQSALAPTRAKIDDLALKIQALRDQQKQLAETIKAATPALQEIENELSKVAAVLGGKRMNQ